VTEHAKINYWLYDVFGVDYYYTALFHHSKIRIRKTELN